MQLKKFYILKFFYYLESYHLIKCLGFNLIGIRIANYFLWKSCTLSVQLLYSLEYYFLASMKAKHFFLVSLESKLHGSGFQSLTEVRASSAEKAGYLLDYALARRIHSTQVNL